MCCASTTRSNRLGVRAVFELDHVGLDGGVAAVFYLLRQLADIVGCLHAFGDTKAIGHRLLACSRGAAVRPVETQFITHLAAQKLPHGRVEHLASDVPERGVDTRHALRCDARGVAHIRVVQIPPDGLSLRGVSADNELREPLNHRGDRSGSAPVRAVAPANHAGIRHLDLHKRPWPKAAINNERFDVRDLEGHSLVLRAQFAEDSLVSKRFNFIC